MRGCFEFEMEDEFGTVRVFDITYEVSKYYPGDYFTPPEGGDLEITSIKENGEEKLANAISETDIDDKTLNYIYECATKHQEEYGDDSYEREED
jgi:hypothetical protein